MDQTIIRRKPDRTRHTLCANLRAAIPNVTSDLLLIIEDDEWYSSDYISTMVGQLSHAELVGERASKYYWPRDSKFRQIADVPYVALCRLGMRKIVYPSLLTACTGTDDPSVDLRLWSDWQGSRRIWFDDEGKLRLSCGIKGMPGRRCGRPKPLADAKSDDPQHSQLRSWVGDDYQTILETVR
jgi:hypothetical protein